MSSIEEITWAKQQRIDELHRFQAGRTALLVVDMQRGFRVENSFRRRSSTLHWPVRPVPLWRNRADCCDRSRCPTPAVE